MRGIPMTEFKKKLGTMGEASQSVVENSQMDYTDAGKGFFALTLA